jgi:hypothetical protein
VQSLDDLARELRERHTMIFRCGARGGGTRFALARAKAWPDDYFILDEGFSSDPTTFLSRAPMRELYGFSLIKPVERTLVNLALTSGALAAALHLDNPETPRPERRGIRHTASNFGLTQPIPPSFHIRTARSRLIFCSLPRGMARTSSSSSRPNMKIGDHVSIRRQEDLSRSPSCCSPSSRSCQRYPRGCRSCPSI